MSTRMELFPTEILDYVNPEKSNLDNYSDDAPIGCLLEVDFEYPDELHDLISDFKLAAENINKRSAL